MAPSDEGLLAPEGEGPTPEDLSLLELGEAGLGVMEVVVASSDRRLEELLAALADGDWRVRRAAATAIAEVDPDTSSSPLLRRLASEDAGERNAAIKALVRIGAPAVEPLAEGMRDTDPDVRNFCALALGLIGEREACAPLMRALGREDDPNVSYHIVEALGRIGDPVAIPCLMKALDAEDWLKAPAVDALGAMVCPEAVTALIELLDDPVVGGVAAEALGRMADLRAVLVLVRAAGDTRGFVSQTHVRALGRVLEPSHQAAELLSLRLRSLLTEESRTRLSRAVGEALAVESAAESALTVALWLDDPGLLPAVLTALDDVALYSAGLRFVTRHLRFVSPEERATLPAHVSVHAAQVLLEAVAIAGEGRDLAWVGPFLTDTNPMLSAAAARAVGALGVASDAAAVLPLLDHPLSEVRDAASAALAALGPCEVTEQLALQSFSESAENRTAVAATLAAMPVSCPEWDDIVARLASDPVSEVRAALTPLLATHAGDDRVRSLLEGLADDEDVRVRRAAMRSLADARGGAGAPLVRARLGDPDHGVRLLAIEALAGDPQAGDEDRLLAALEDVDPRVRIAALDALGRSGAKAAAPAVESLLDAADPEVRGAALSALAAIDPREGRAVATAAAYDADWRVRQNAVAVLATISDEAGRRVIRHALCDEDESVRQVAVAVCGNALGDEGIDRLVVLLTDRAAGGQAEDALLQVARTSPAAVTERLAHATGRARSVLLRVTTAVGFEPALRTFAASADPEERFYGLLGLSAIGAAVDELPEPAAPLERASAEVLEAMRARGGRRDARA